MRVTYSPANRAWVWVFGDSLLRPAPDLPLFWNRRADLVSALDAIGIVTAKNGVTTAKPGMRLPESNPKRRKRKTPGTGWVKAAIAESAAQGLRRMGYDATVDHMGEWGRVSRVVRVNARARRKRQPSRRKSRARKVRGTAQTNPRDGGLATARRTFRRLNEIEPGKVTRVRTTRGAPKTLVKLGELVSLRYRSDKYAGSRHNPHGKTLLYEHETKPPRPVLATDPGGREVHIVGGRMRPTPDGLVN